MKKLNVVQICKLYHPWIGGVETIAKQTAEGIKDECNSSVVTCQPEGKGVVEMINGVPVKKCGSLGIHFSMPVSFSFIGAVRKAARTADILHLHVPFPLGDLAILLSGFKGKVVVWWHSDVVNQKKLLVLYKPIMKRLLERADLIMAATQGNINGSPYIKPFEDKCCVIPYGIDTKRYLSHRSEPVLTDLLSDKSNIKILFVGRLVYYKGIDVLINAFAGVKGAELFIVGDGALKDDCVKLIDKPGLNEKVHLLGRLSDDELLSAFQDCDIFAFPSVAKSEAFGIVQLEAMVYGKPVVNTSLDTGVPYVSVDGETGITVPPGDSKALAKALQRLIDDEGLRRTYGENAKKRVIEHFDIDNMIRNVLREYNKLTGE